jgi:hypothetical protein
MHRSGYVGCAKQFRHYLPGPELPFHGNFYMTMPVTHIERWSLWCLITKKSQRLTRLQEKWVVDNVSSDVACFPPQKSFLYQELLLQNRNY